MSLFKVRDFWSFDLGQLPAQYSCSAQATTTTTTTTGRQSYAKSSSIDSAQPLLLDLDPTERSAGNFIVAQGRFHSIGHHDVFVCADLLEGLVFIMQVPECDQIKHLVSSKCNDDVNKPFSSSPERRNRDADSVTTDEEQAKEGHTISGSSSSSKNNAFRDRQLLLAKRLGFPIVDVKCGYFTSALKQSIAVLGFDKIVIFHVKRHQVDLLTAASSGGDGHQVTLDENLFSHELEEHYRLDLLSSELASNIVVLANHAESIFSKSSANTDSSSTHHHHHHHHKDLASSASATSGNSKGTNKHAHSVHQLQLPQRDTLVVQYTNQFIISLIDYKKIIGHFLLSDPVATIGNSSIGNSKQAGENSQATSDHHHESHIQQLAKFVGPMPAAFLRGGARGSSSLIISLSDNRIYSLSLAKLATLAKQNIMKRVALDLLHDSGANKDLIVSKAYSSGSGQPSSLAYDRIKAGYMAADLESRIEIDLESTSDWNFELACAPIQMLGISISPVGGNTTNSKANSLSTNNGQLLVMSRYNLDLFDNSGQHIWSQRFETPLICLYSYILTGSVAANTVSLEASQASEEGDSDRMLTLLCTDCLSADKSNLLILDENRIVWSALLNTKPLQLWRANLGKMSGTLVALDVGQGHLSASYLGTNMENNDQELNLESQQSSNELASLELLDAPLFPSAIDDTDDESKDDGACAVGKGYRVKQSLRGGSGAGFESRKLKVDIRLEAFDQWPNMYVKSNISIVPESSNVLQNILVTIEFDDLIYFEPAAPNCESAIFLSEGVVQIPLGSCWPDRSEPMTLAGRFALRSSQQQQLGGSTTTGKTSDWSAKVAATSGGTSIQQQSQKQVFNLNLMPKSLKVRLYLRFNEAHLSSSLQQESFLLPLNIVARLVHIDYSSGLNQSLDDVQANLNPYNRLTTTYNRPRVEGDNREIGGLQSSNQQKNKAAEAQEMTASPYYLCDFFVRTGSDIIELVDEIIESDLICRGLNSESTNYKLECQREGRKLSVLENINLLAQSLDCRLKYKSFPHPPTSVLRQSSEEYSPSVLVSIALKVPSGANLIESDLISAQSKQTSRSQTKTTATDAGSDPGFAIIWLHLCDLSANESVIPAEMIDQHLKEWKAYDCDLVRSLDDEKNANISEHLDYSGGLSDEAGLSRPILVSIECDHPVPVLFLQGHLLERLRKRSKTRPFHLENLTESAHDSIEINYQNILRMNNFIAISVNLHDRLNSAISRYQTEFVNDYEKLKEELRKEYYKFHVITMSSLSLSKRLFKLPDHMHKQFLIISQLTKQYQLNLIRILIELEKLKVSDYQFSKIPEASVIFLELNGKRGLLRWPTINQIVD